MVRKILPAVLVIVAILAVIGYVFYVPGRVTLSVKDPPPEAYDDSIQAIYVTFARIEVHAANAGNESGWHTIVSSGTIDLLQTLDVSKELGSSLVPPGKYTEVRFFAGEAVVKINGANVTYTIPSGAQTGVKVKVGPGGFQIYGGQSVSIQLDLAFRNSEILSNPTKTLVPVVSAAVR